MPIDRRGSAELSRAERGVADPAPISGEPTSLPALVTAFLALPQHKRELAVDQLLIAAASLAPGEKRAAGTGLSALAASWRESSNTYELAANILLFISEGEITDVIRAWSEARLAIKTVDPGVAK